MIAWWAVLSWSMQCSGATPSASSPSPWGGGLPERGRDEARSVELMSGSIGETVAHLTRPRTSSVSAEAET